MGKSYYAQFVCNEAREGDAGAAFSNDEESHGKRPPVTVIIP
ncbi:hypothetical protein [Paenisporosarcina sp. TG20]|nr:hypothetical protein [Paenisporosarcina sp. TG20]